MAEQGLQKSTENRLISPAQIKFAENLNLILEDAKNISEQTNPMVKEIMFANAKAEIMTLLTDEIMVNIYSLFGDPDGVKMDKAYGNDVKKRIFIQAAMQGLSCRGNQINVIGGNMYIRAQGYLPKLRSFPGLDSFVFPFRHRIPVKDATTFTTSVTTDMEWVFKGKKFSESVTYPVARQDGQGNDAVLGKATTKMCAWLWNKISGEDTIDDSGVYTNAEVVSSTTNKPSDENKHEEATIISEETNMISQEWQAKFDTYIQKATGLEDLNTKAKQWLSSKVATANGASFSEHNGFISSETVNLDKYKELIEKFKTV